MDTTDTIRVAWEPGDSTKGLKTLCDTIDADGLTVRRWAVELLTPEGLGTYDSKHNAEIEESDEQEDIRSFLERRLHDWTIRDWLVSVATGDGDIVVYTTGDATESAGSTPG
jgi:hypothetical protein